MNNNIVKIKFYTNGTKTRVIGILDENGSFMFQTSDDRYLERYWDWTSHDNRKEILLTRGSYEESEWRELNFEGPDLSIIHDAIAALNYNMLHTKIDNKIKSHIESIIKGYRIMSQIEESKLIPDPIPYPKDSEITNLLGFNTISKYGVILKRLTHDKIELVRRWRNDPKISQYMEYREEITPEMQEKWFRKIDKPDNLFYIIEYKNKAVGLINIKDITDGVGEGGIFIWDDSTLNSDISFRSHLALFDEYFKHPHNNLIISHVLKFNKRAQRFTKYLGFKLSEKQEEVENQLYVLDRETYLNNINRERYIKHSKLLDK